MPEHDYEETRWMLKQAKEISGGVEFVMLPLKKVMQAALDGTIITDVGQFLTLFRPKK